MDKNAIFLSFIISSLVIAITVAAIYISFGPSAKNLIDPFEEDND